MLEGRGDKMICILPAIITVLMTQNGTWIKQETATMRSIDCVVLEDSDHGVYWIDCNEGYKKIKDVVYPHPVTPSVRWIFKDQCYPGLKPK